MALAEGRGSKIESESESCGGREDTTRPQNPDQLSVPPSDHECKRHSGLWGHCSESDNAAPAPADIQAQEGERGHTNKHTTEATFRDMRGKLHRHRGVSLPDRGQCKQDRDSVVGPGLAVSRTSRR